MANERKDYVDFLKAIAIFIVILGHVNCANDSVKELIYSFHMPLFFFSTGLLLKDSYDVVLSKGYIRKKIERLIVPYLVWGLIFSDYSRDNLLKIIYGSYKAIKDTNTLSSIWYIPCLILAELMCCYLIKLSFNKKWLLVLYMCALWCAGAFIPDIDGIHNLGYPWQFNIAFTAAGFIMLGKLWDIYLRDFFKKHIMMQITGLIIGVLMLLTYKINLNNCKFVLMASGRYGNYLLFLVTAVGGCLTVL